MLWLRLGVSVPLPLVLRVNAWLPLALCVGLRVTELVAEADAVVDCVGVGKTLGVPEEVPLCVGVPDSVLLRVGVIDVVALSVGVHDIMPLSVGAPDSVTLGVTVCELVFVRDRVYDVVHVCVRLALCDADAEPVAVELGEAVWLDDRVGLVDSEPEMLGELDELGVSVREALWLLLRVPVPLGVSVSVADPVPVLPCEALSEELGVHAELPDIVCDVVADTLELPDTLSVCVVDGVSVEVTLPVGVGVIELLWLGVAV